MIRSPRRASALLVLPLLVGLAACGDDAEPASTEPAASDPASSTPASGGADLDGRTFLSTGTTGLQLADGAVLRLEFGDGRVSASGGCNQMNGGYALVDGALRVDPMASTEMACEQPLMDQDTMVAAFLMMSPVVTLSGDDLLLTTPDATITMLDREVADPDRPLEGTRWVVDTIVTGDAASSVPTDAEASIALADGTAAVEAGCNTGSASAEVGDGTITFGPLALTKMACADDVMELEAAVTATLTGAVTFEIEAARLTLTSASGDGLVLHADE